MESWIPCASAQLPSGVCSLSNAGCPTAGAARHLFPAASLPLPSTATPSPAAEPIDLDPCFPLSRSARFTPHLSEPVAPCCGCDVAGHVPVQTAPGRSTGTNTGGDTSRRTHARCKWAGHGLAAVVPGKWPQAISVAPKGPVAGTVQTAPFRAMPRRADPSWAWPVRSGKQANLASLAGKITYKHTSPEPGCAMCHLEALFPTVISVSKQSRVAAAASCAR